MSVFARYKRSKDGKRLDGSYSIEGKENTPSASHIPSGQQNPLIQRHKEVVESFTVKLNPLDVSLIKSIDKLNKKDYPFGLTKLGITSNLYRIEVTGIDLPLYYYSNIVNSDNVNPEKDFAFYIIDERSKVRRITRLGNLAKVANSSSFKWSILDDENKRRIEIRENKQANYLSRQLGLSLDLFYSIENVFPSEAPNELAMDNPVNPSYSKPRLWKFDVTGLKGPIYYHAYKRLWLNGINSPGYRESVRLYKVLDNGSLKEINNKKDLDDYMDPS